MTNRFYFDLQVRRPYGEWRTVHSYLDIQTAESDMVAENKPWPVYGQEEYRLLYCTV